MAVEGNRAITCPVNGRECWYDLPIEGDRVQAGMPLKIHLLGGFAVRDSDGQPIAFPTRKAEALLAVLAAPPGTAHPRERLATLLWPNSGDEQARSSLRQTLALLRKALAPTGLPGIVARGETLSLDPEG